MIVIGASTTEDVAGTLKTEQISLQLNALDNEVFVVTSVDIDPQLCEQVAATLTSTTAWVTKQNPNGVRPSYAQSNVIANKVIAQDNTGGDGFTLLQSGSIETPSTMMEYLDIIATPDFFLNVQGANNVGRMGVACKVYGYRAKADASTYAALVQSEVLSS